MKNKLCMWMATVGVAVLTFVAMMTTVSACAWANYQPEEPACLREE